MRRPQVPLDVTHTVRVSRPHEAVSAYCARVETIAEWAAAIDRIETPGEPLRIGHGVLMCGSFLSREHVWEMTVQEYDPDAQLTLSSRERSGSTTFCLTWGPDGDGATLTVRVQGRTSVFGRMPSMVLEAVIRRALIADLDRLDELIDRHRRAREDGGAGIG